MDISAAPALKASSSSLFLVPQTCTRDVTTGSRLPLNLLSLNAGPGPKIFVKDLRSAQQQNKKHGSRGKQAEAKRTRCAVWEAA